MNVKPVLEKAIKNGQKALSEYDSKKILSEYKIPVTRESLAKTCEEAVQIAESIGYPVVLKACSHTLMHKSEGGFVEIFIKNKHDVKEAFERITSKKNAGIDGILVQEMASGQRELVLGFFRDPQFGPCVMAGLGGVMTEILNDTSFRMAPLDEIEADDMLSDLRSRKILEPFRGQKGVDKQALCRAIVSLGNIGLENEEIAEIDINPVIIRPDGNIIAVDALVVLNKD